MTVCNVACGLEVCGNSEERPTFPSFTDSMSVSRTFAQMGGLVEGMMKRFVNLNPTWRSKSSPSGDLGRFFPLVPDHALQDLPGSDADSWMSCICMGLNSYYGAEILPKTVRLPRASGAKSALKGCREAVELTLNWSETSESFSWEEFWKVKSVDYRGDEVQVAQSFAWKNIEPTIPPQVGTIPLSAVCGEGTLAYVENFEEFLIPEADQVLLKPPRVQVQDSDWEAVVQGLVSRKLCCIMPVKDLYHVGGRPVLNGLFGVSKHEFTDGVEHLRLIMNLCPINALCRPLHSDIGTLPSWACVGPLFLGDHQDLVVSSEDIRCFFYNFEIPVEWRKYMGFNKLVPPHLTPNEHAGEDCVLASAVLPMGFLNSVGIAQHIHRRVVLAARHKEPGLPQGEAEIRKDRPATNTSQMWRVYLDNYDELEKMDRETADKIAGTMSDPTALVRAEYLKQGLPRHEKKGVQQSRLAEVQGAMVDGHAGLVYPKPQKILKYIQVVARLLEDGWSTQRQLQVAAGGLVYVSMFRRPLLGTLNALWRHIESFKGEPPVVRKQLPKEVEWEFLRFLGLLPLAHINLRLGIDATVTASDASLVGGGFCASSGLTPYGCAAANLEVRGDVPEWEDMDRVLSIGLFDGIGALRVALDAIGAPVCGHISVEPNSHAQRTLEANFSETEHVSSVQEVDDELVLKWSLRYSGASIVIIGAGPPCPGVSGLNADRKGALRDARSVLYQYVEYIYNRVKRRFFWCAVHKLMESVASMDPQDRMLMSDSVGLQPWSICASGVSLARRPRLYWVSWELYPCEGMEVAPPENKGWAALGNAPPENKGWAAFGNAPPENKGWAAFGNAPPENKGCACGKVTLHVEVDERRFLEPGWRRLTSDPLPTFTTSRPRAKPGNRPAGLSTLSISEAQHWERDWYRFPPYQYQTKNLVHHETLGSRLPSVTEREAILGFPIGYTLPCAKKGELNAEDLRDVRLSLLGNSWSVPVVAILLHQLLAPLGLVAPLTIKEVVELCSPGGGRRLQSYLFRPPLQQIRVARAQGDCSILVQKLAGLASQKGEDLMLQAPTEHVVRHQRLRVSIPARLWRWKTLGSWPWKTSGDHINLLELRAIWTSLRWRIERKRSHHQRFLHLTDSAVCLNALVRGRSSSRRLRPVLSRINALILASHVHPIWGFVSSSQNPADRPSRRIRTPWGKRKN